MKTQENGPHHTISLSNLLNLEKLQLAKRNMTDRVTTGNVNAITNVQSERIFAKNVFSVRFCVPKEHSRSRQH